MTGRWMTRTAVARRLGKSVDEIEALIASGELHLESIAGDHEAISEASVERYLAEHPSEDPLPLWIEDEYRRLQDHDDTPDDEGDHA
ncbi:hypothetical protein [Nonomuraea pusilla]|uniref:Helix-turn-helix domain-containing protein n=1 Tax=Nonomuraea pusilla TaxID=46177 RepID=A0A1H8K6U6_9ACTN|nr:hypothetical protein [Nonomuraea pusilla]SEN88759.1 hypothetical protein SAMN05660976_08541 [Nonomuraea pusilla]